MKCAHGLKATTFGTQGSGAPSEKIEKNKACAETNEQQKHKNKKYKTWFARPFVTISQTPLFSWGHTISKLAKGRTATMMQPLQ